MPDLHCLSADDYAHYQKEGYLLLRGVVSETTLQLSQRVLERWVDALIGTWLEQGLLENDHADAPFDQRLLRAYEEAGQPRYSRSPRRELVSEEMYRILTAPELLDIAAELLQSQEVSVHSVFNARPKLPQQRWTDTPWHQDAQYFRDAEHTHVPTFWFPLVDVTTRNSCLQVAPGYHRGTLHDGYNDPETGFLGLSPEVRATLEGVPVEMRRGDLLCFTQITPHGALPNRSDRIRWSMDLRYEATEKATEKGQELGLIARSPRTPERVTSCEAWLAKWTDRPAGSY